MNINLKAVYFCYTSAGRWGKGLTLEEAMANAGMPLGKKTSLQYAVQAALFNDPTDEELENMRDCISANPLFGSPEYYQSERTQEDSDMINRLHVGWLTVIDKSK